METNYPTLRVASIVRAAARYVLVLAVAAALFAADPAAGQTPQEAATLLNLQHALQVRKAFLLDKELAAYNLGVRVDNRIAYLWGAVPSTKLLAKALTVARSLPDIADVRSNLYVDPTLDPVPQYLPDPDTTTTGPPTHLPVPAQVAPDNAKPASATKNPGAETAKTTAAQKPPVQGSWQAAPTESKTSFKAIPIVAPGQSEDQALFVLPAIAIPATPSVPKAPLPTTLGERILLLKGQDQRYQHLTVVVDAGRVYLHGAASQWSDVHQLAKALAQLPGVENVIIGQVQIKTATQK